MSGRFVFGKDITYTWYPLEDNENLSDADVQTLEGLLDSIYIFEREQRPTRDEARNGTGADQTILAWTANSNFGFDFTIDAIDDPNPTEETHSRDFWIAINYQLEAGEQIQTARRVLPLERIARHSERLTVTDDDLKELWNEVIDFTKNANERNQKVRQAKIDIQRDFTTDLVDWAQIYNVDELNRATAWKALSYIAVDKREIVGDKFDLLYQHFTAQFEKEMTSIHRLKADRDNDGDPRTVISPRGQKIAHR